MFTVIGRFASQAFALMRIIIGVLYSLHGVQLLFGFPPMKGMTDVPLPPILHVAGYLELIGGILVALGLVTGIAAFINSGTMAVAYWTAHAPHGWHPLANQGELAAVYCFIFLYIAAHGAGVWSIDSVIRGRSATVATTS